MFDLLAKLLAFYYELIPNYGVAIALFTITVMLLLTPLTLKGTRSMMMMQAVQPEMKRIQAQYKDDRQKLNEELLKFYKENNINPLSGCLPLLVQLPVFFVLYQVLRGLTQIKDNVDVVLPNGVVRHIEHGFVPDHLDHSTRMFQDLLGKTEMNSFGMDLAQSVTKAASHGFTKAIPYIILIVGVFLTSVVQQRQISGRNPAAQSNPQTQMMMKLGPTLITGFSIFAPGGLVIYFFVSNLFRVGQQALISHTIYKSPEAKALLERQHKEAEEKKKREAGQPKKGFFERMMGDAAPQIKEQRAKANGAGKGSKDARSGTNGDGKPAPKPPLAKSGGRTTPQGSRSSAARKKRKRK
jgi:YidC/Oxa1 family membrane protein insertase